MEHNVVQGKEILTSGLEEYREFSGIHNIKEERWYVVQIDFSFHDGATTEVVGEFDSKTAAQDAISEKEGNTARRRARRSG